MIYDDSRRFWNVAEASEHTGLRPSWFYQRSAKNKLPGARRAGKYLIIKVDEFLRALDSGQIG